MNLALAVSTGFFVVFFTLFLVAASMVVDDPRWRQPATSFRDFLKSTVLIDSGAMRGRDVLLHIALLPMSLALASTVIGLAWSVVRAG